MIFLDGGIGVLEGFYRKRIGEERGLIVFMVTVGCVELDNSIV